jgi:hypothetical protein
MGFQLEGIGRAPLIYIQDIRRSTSDTETRYWYLFL